MTKDELQAKQEFFEKANEILGKRMLLLRDLAILDKKYRPLNSFEQGIKEETERLLNNLENPETMTNS